MIRNFKARGNYAFVDTTHSIGQHQIKKISRCFKPVCGRGGGGGGGSIFLKMPLHQKYSPRIKTSRPKLIILLSNYLEKYIISNTTRLMAFTQECL